MFIETLLLLNADVVDFISCTLMKKWNQNLNMWGVNND